MTDQNNNLVVQQGNIRLYAVGGAGIGISKYFEQERGRRNEGYAEFHPVYADTSKASTFGVPESAFYHIQNKDGSGGVRKFNAADISRSTNELLDLFPPMEMNVLVHSTTGGSGSVLGPSIASELLKRDLPVIVFCVGGDDSKQYILNSINTMLSYENISKVRDMPIVIDLKQNGKDGTIEEVDLAIQLAISCLSVLYSRRNRNLDTRDLYNWINFHNVTSFSPQIGVLSVHQGKLNLPDQNLISVVTLNKDLNNTRLDQHVEYQRVGVPSLMEDETRLKYPLHFAISDGFLDTVIKGLRKQVAEYDSKAAARTIRNKLSTGNEDVTDNGLVL